MVESSPVEICGWSRWLCAHSSAFIFSQVRIINETLRSKKKILIHIAWKTGFDRNWNDDGGGMASFETANWIDLSQMNQMGIETALAPPSFLSQSIRSASEHRRRNSRPYKATSPESRAGRMDDFRNVSSFVVVFQRTEIVSQIFIYIFRERRKRGKKKEKEEKWKRRKGFGTL